MPRPIAQAWAIARCDNPRSCLSRRTSRSFLISSLLAGIASAPPVERATACRVRLPMSVHDDRNDRSTSRNHRSRCRNPCSTSRNRCSTSAEIRVHLPPESVFKISRNTQNSALGSPTAENLPRLADRRRCPDTRLRSWAGNPFRAANLLRRRLLAPIIGQTAPRVRVPGPVSPTPPPRRPLALAHPITPFMPPTS